MLLELKVELVLLVLRPIDLWPRVLVYINALVAMMYFFTFILLCTV